MSVETCVHICSIFQITELFKYMRTNIEEGNYYSINKIFKIFDFSSDDDIKEISIKFSKHLAIKDYLPVKNLNIKN